MRGQVFYNVAPRYSSGSPGQVDHKTAVDVANQELKIIQRLKTHPGMYGPEKDLELEALGIRGIVYSHAEIGKYIYVTDYLSRETFRVPVKDWQGRHWHSRNDREQFKFSDIKDEVSEHFWGLTLVK